MKKTQDRDKLIIFIRLKIINGQGRLRNIGANMFRFEYIDETQSLRGTIQRTLTLTKKEIDYINGNWCAVKRHQRR